MYWFDLDEFVHMMNVGKKLQQMKLPQQFLFEWPEKD